MADHDLMSVLEEQRASTTVWVAVCRCGHRSSRPCRELAAEAHETHFRGEMAAPFIADIRETLGESK